MPTEHKLLIKRCIIGNTKAQMQLYNLYCDAMFNVVCRYFKNKEDAKDIMQEGFLKAFLHIHNYKDDYSFGSWLKRIIINQCIDTLRKQKITFVDIDTEQLEVSDDNIWDFDVFISKELILDNIEKLPEKHKIVVKLYLIEGYDHEEVSQILNIPIKTSRTHLRRGKQQLKQLLKTKYNETRY
ncbi:MAG: RNA polymerase sigma factor [Flavobacteriaceae bacterium]|tara:strand:+ start:2169 stop:2717 length:549 start_codon:yes stop_codon:yes gene_type:complete